MYESEAKPSRLRDFRVTLVPPPESPKPPNWTDKFNSGVTLGKVGLVIVLLTVFFWICKTEIYTDALVIEPIHVTKDLNDEGYTPDVVAHILADGINKIIVNTQTVDHTMELVPSPQSVNLDIKVSDTSISMETLIHYLRRILQHEPTVVSGELIQLSGKVRMNVRLTRAGLPGARWYAFTSTPQGLVEKPAEAVMGGLKASSVAEKGRYAGQNAAHGISSSLVIDGPVQDCAHFIVKFTRPYILASSELHYFTKRLRKSYGPVDYARICGTGRIDGAEGIENYVKNNLDNAEFHGSKQNDANAYIVWGQLLDLQAKEMQKYAPSIGKGKQLLLTNLKNLSKLLVEESKDKFRAAIEIDPDSYIAHDDLAAMLLKYEGKDQAEEALNQSQLAIGLNPEYEDAYRDCGWAYKKLGLRRRAIAMYQKAIEIDPADAYAYINLSSAYDSEGDVAGDKDARVELYHQAALAAQRATERDPSFVEAWFDWGIALKDEGHVSGDLNVLALAPGKFQEALRLDSSQALAAKYCGYAYHCKKAYDKADYWYKDAVTRAKRDKDWTDEDTGDVTRWQKDLLDGRPPSEAH